MQLADTSAWLVAGRTSHAAAEFASAVESGSIGTCSMVAFELLRSARSGSDFDEIQEELDALRGYQIGPRQWRRALQVYRELAHEGGAH